MAAYSFLPGKFKRVILGKQNPIKLTRKVGMQCHIGLEKNMKALAIFVLFFCAMLVAGIHPVNENSICQNPVCRHPKSAHDKHFGMCLLFGDNHCLQFTPK